MDEDKQILFESDMTCCVCRIKEGRPVQIHHIDLDHANNHRDNKAVLCLHCHHGLAHTDVQFGRNLDPDMVRLYDANWWGICAAKLNLGSAKLALTEYQAEALLEVSLVCHAWKDTFMNACQPFRSEAPDAKYRDVWDLLIDFMKRETWETEPLDVLLTTTLDNAIDDLKQIMASHGHALPEEIMTLIIRTNRRLGTEQVVHQMMKYGSSHTGQPYTPKPEGVLRAFMELARAAGKLTAKAKDSPTASGGS